MPPHHTSPLVHLANLSKEYREGGRTLRVLDGVGCRLDPGTFTAIIGRSGSGKTTLLNLLSGIDTPSRGEVIIGGRDLTHLNEEQRTLFRRHHIGIIFQFFNLIPTLTVAENIRFPLELSGASRERIENLPGEYLQRVGLDDRADTFPDHLSGGEKQRVAIVRALIHRPTLLLADEPTGNLDQETGRQVAQLLAGLVREEGLTLVMATHSLQLARQADQIFTLHRGQLMPGVVEEEPPLESHEITPQPSMPKR
ncbi:MAG: ABC transporter ATP-binding protein [Magnetococcales bacterium]|nr:ABC transporter ATP-binding protein [Magnetococcales bacterium]